jgi:hypothetical protein
MLLRNQLASVRSMLNENSSSRRIKWQILYQWMSLPISVDVKECVESSCCRMIGWSKRRTNDKSASSIILPLGKRPGVKISQFLRSIGSTTTTLHHYWKKQDPSISGQPSPSHHAFGFFKRQAICRFEKYKAKASEYGYGIPSSLRTKNDWTSLPLAWSAQPFHEKTIQVVTKRLTRT